MFPIKTYLYGGILLLILGLGLSVWWLRDSLGEAKKTISTQNEQIIAADKLIKDQIENIARNNLASVEYQKQLQVKKHENDTLLSSVNTGSTKLLVRAKCPAVQNTSTDTSRAEPASPELDVNARQDYFTHRREIILLEAGYDRCIKQLQDDRELINQP